MTSSPVPSEKAETWDPIELHVLEGVLAIFLGELDQISKRYYVEKALMERQGNKIQAVREAIARKKA